MLCEAIHERAPKLYIQAQPTYYKLSDRVTPFDFAPWDLTHPWTGGSVLYYTILKHSLFEKLFRKLLSHVYDIVLLVLQNCLINYSNDVKVSMQFSLHFIVVACCECENVYRIRDAFFSSLSDMREFNQAHHHHQHKQTTIPRCTTIATMASTHSTIQ